MPTDGWVRAALADDEMVVELLYRLKQSSELAASQQRVKSQFLLPPLGWGQRQPRSKLAGKKNRIRCSPTTPLSYSCGAGTSASEGCDDSSRPSDPSSSGRSKGSFAYDTATAINKRSKRKRTIAELREAESLLIKDTGHLKKEVETMRVALKEQQVRGDNFKRFKLNLRTPPVPDNMKVVDSSHAPPPAATKYGSAELLLTMAMQRNQQLADPCYFKSQEEDKNPMTYFSPPMMTMQNNQQLADPCYFKAQKEEEEENPACFVLPDLNMVPDLNMMPAEDDSSIEILYRSS